MRGVANLKMGSLFAGIGGFDLAATRCGIEVAWQVEIDEWCRQVLAKHWPEVPKYGDIREVEELPWVDIIAGGFPCQPVSLAGRGLAQGDPRWLWPEFERVIRMVRPRYVVVENVPGLLSRGMGDVLGGLASCGYDAEWQRIPAAAVGAPHIRERVFVVAYPTGQRELALWRQQLPQDRYPRRKVDIWANQPPAIRMADGVPRRMDRLRGLGNAIVPQVAEWIFRQILDYEAKEVA